MIHAPNGSFYCNDDSFSTSHPTIDFVSPATGMYDVWVTTPTAGGAVATTLFVTENTSNHP